MNSEWAALGAVVISVITAGFSWLANRQKASAETQLSQARADRTYADMAQEARREAEQMRLQLRQHDKRWILVTEILRDCIHCPLEVPNRLKERLQELSDINHLAEIDNGK